jgi:hypothetical protein
MGSLVLSMEIEEVVCCKSEKGKGVTAKNCNPFFLARPRRFERPTNAFGGHYSIQLSYGRKLCLKVNLQ